MNVRLTALVLAALAFVAGCKTPQQTAYTTLAAASQALSLGTSAWDAYVHQARAANSIPQSTLVDEALKVQAAVAKASATVTLAIDVAGTANAPSTATVTAAVADAVNLINSFKK